MYYGHALYLSFKQKQLSGIMSSSKSLLGTRQGRVSLDALWRERSWGHGKREIRDCWVALDPIRLRILWILDPIYQTASHLIFSSLICLQQARLLCVPSQFLSENHRLANCELVKVTSGHGGWDGMSRLCLECAQPCGVVGGAWKRKTTDERGKGRMYRGPSGQGIFNCASFLLFLLVFPLLFSHLYSFFPSSSPPPFPLLSPFCSFLTPRYRKGDPRSPSREWQINSAVPE